MYGLVKAFAGCLFDKRAPDKTRHSLADLIGRRIFGIACGHPTATTATALPTTVLERYAEPAMLVARARTMSAALSWRRSR